MFFFYAAALLAEVCDENPIACTPAELCLRTTELLDGTRYWIEDEANEYLQVSRQYGLDCKAQKALSPCEKDPNVCSILQLCEISTTLSNSAKKWSSSNQDHVKLAKSYGLTCGVSAVQTSSLTQGDPVDDLTKCENDLKNCTSDKLCELSTWGPSHNKQWKVGRYVKFVDEAKRRNILCGVAEANILEDCKATPETCTDSNLCKYATYNVDGITRWKGPIFRILVDEAKKRGLSCSVSSSMKVKTDAASPKSPHEKCRDNLENCNDQTLCKLATIGNIQKYFDKNRYPDLVTEAKKRGLTCGVIETTAQATITQQKTSKQISTFLSFLKGKTFAENRSYCFTVPWSFDDKTYYIQGRKGSERNYHVI